MNQIFKSINLRFKQFSYNGLNAMILRNKGQAIAGVIIRLLSVIAGRVTPTFVKVIKTTLAKVSGVANSQGLPGVAKYLKAVGISTVQAIAGYKMNQTPRISTTNTGIPRLFPVQLRRMIRMGQTAAMRLALTLSSLSRDIEFESKPKLGSIVNPYTGDKYIIKELERFIPRFVKLFILPKLPSDMTSLRDMVVGKFSYFTIFKSSPYVPGKESTAKILKDFGVKLISTHPIVLIRSALGLEPHIVDALNVLADIVKAPRTEGPMSWVRMIRDLFKDPGKAWFFRNVERIPSGKLGLKQEAAGKVRVFAMVDPWTQFILRPFHKAIFRILSKWPMDGTFNQLRPLRRAWRFPSLFSMDLSSATDRLPMALQIPLFKEVFSMTSKEAEAWSTAMVGRLYRLPFGVYHKGEAYLSYAVGQPMGALSSWAMLALTHHFIVQVAAWQTGVTPDNKLFRNYAVLGDDIVIFDAKVAKRYHKIMTRLGVECNLAKSIMSPNGEVLEFAKRVFLKGINISPTPLAEFHAALMNPVALFEYKRKYNLSWPQTVKAAGFGFRVVGSVDSKNIFKLNAKVRYLMFVGLLQDPTAILDALLNMRKGLQTLELQKLISDFLWDEYRKLWRSYRKNFDKLQTIRFAPQKDLMKAILPLKEQRLLYHNLYWAIYQIPKLRASVDYTEGMKSIQNLFTKPDYGTHDILGKLALFITLLEIDTKISGVSVNVMNTDKLELVSSNPVQVKLFKLQKSFAKFLTRLKPIVKEVPITNVEPLLSGFVPLAAVKVPPESY
jgi:hypothetical protein